MPSDAIEDAFRQIITPQSPSLIMNNKVFQKMITYGIDVQVKQVDASYRTEKVYIFDFEKPLNNEFMVANQFTIVEQGGSKKSEQWLYLKILFTS